MGIRTSSVRRTRFAFCRFGELRPGFLTLADILSTFVLALAQLISVKRPKARAHRRMDAPWRRRLPEGAEGTAVEHRIGAGYCDRQEILNQPFDVGLTVAQSRRESAPGAANNLLSGVYCASPRAASAKRALVSPD